MWCITISSNCRNTTFPLVNDPTNENQTYSDLTRVSGWDPDPEKATKEITGWNKDENNINIKVAKNPKDAIVLTGAFGADEVIEEDEDEHIYRINFPQDGEAPLIIAVDRTIGWMDEYTHIPEAWWKDGEFYKKDDEPEFDYTVYELNIDETTGEAILDAALENGGAWYVQVNMYKHSDANNNLLVDAYGMLLKALYEGYTNINIYFENPTHGRYRLRTGKWGLMQDNTDFNVSNVLTISITDDLRAIIRVMDGLRIELDGISDSNNGGNYNITKITASKP